MPFIIFGLLFALLIHFQMSCLFPGAILVAVAIGRFADNRSPPKSRRANAVSILLDGTKPTTFGGDQGGERSVAEAENRGRDPGIILRA